MFFVRWVQIYLLTYLLTVYMCMSESHRASSSSNAVYTDPLFSASVGLRRRIYGHHVGLHYHTHMPSDVPKRRFRLRHDGERIFVDAAVHSGRNYGHVEWTAGRYAVTKGRTVDRVGEKNDQRRRHADVCTVHSPARRARLSSNSDCRLSGCVGRYDGVLEAEHRS